MSRLLAMRRLAAVLLLGLPGLSVRGDDPSPAVPRLYSASDLPRLARGVSLPAGGEYTVKVWAPTRQGWGLEQDGATVVLKSRDGQGGTSPRWQSIGKVSGDDKMPVKIVVDGLADRVEANETEARKPAGPATRPPVAVPALILLTPDADYEPAAAMDLIRGRIATTEPAADPRRTQVRTNQEGATFRAPSSEVAWRDRARAVREQMLVTLGLWPMPPRTALDPQVHGRLERDGYAIEKVVLTTLPGFTLAGNLYKPIGKSGRLPAVLCPHGHWEDGRVNPEVQMRCIRLAKLGFVVFMYDMVGYNDSKSFGHAFLNPRLDRWGLSLATLQTWNSLRAVDWLTTLPDVDSTRIACTGESGGGTQTFLLTALDQRIALAAPIVMVSDGFQGGCVCENAAGLRHGTDNVEFAALCAPRPMKLVGATGDWTARTMTNAYPAIRGVYELVGQPERVSADVFDFPHNYNQTSRNAVYPFLAHWLLGVEGPESVKEGPQAPEPPDVLRAFDEAHPAPASRRTPEQLETELIATRQQQLDRLAPSEQSVAWEAARDFLLTSLKVRVGLKNPSPFEVESAQVRRVRRDALTAVHHEVGRKATGEHIPVVRLLPDHPTGRVTLVFSPHGKAGLVTAEGKPTERVRALLDLGQSVVGFDPLLVGEALDPASYAERRPGTAHYECYNPTLAADRLQDLATVLAWARSQPDVREVNLLGEGRWGPLALLARPALEGVARTAVNLHEFDYGDGSSEISDDMHLPGVLQFGGLKAAAALVAPAPLWLERSGPTFAADWPRQAYTLADALPSLHLSNDRSEAAVLARWLDSGEKPK